METAEKNWIGILRIMLIFVADTNDALNCIFRLSWLNFSRARVNWGKKKTWNQFHWIQQENCILFCWFCFWFESCFCFCSWISLPSKQKARLSFKTDEKIYFLTAQPGHFIYILICIAITALKKQKTNRSKKTCCSAHTSFLLIAILMINDDYYAVWFYDNNNYNGLYGYILFIQAMISFDCDGNLFMLYFFSWAIRKMKKWSKNVHWFQVGVCVWNVNFCFESFDR